MGEFQLPRGTDGIDKLPETNTLLQNLFHSHDENNSIISRPGIPLIATVGGTSRGGFEWNGSLYYVYSQELRKFTNPDTGAFSVIGTIAGDDLIFSAEGAVTIAIVARGSASYTLDKSDNLVNTSGNPNFVPFVSVTAINGRAIYVPEDGQNVRFSDVGAFGTIGALSFFTPEQRPDDTRFCFTLDNYLYLAGTQSIERYKNVTTSQIFARVGSAFDFGYIGGFLEVDQAIVFIGRKRNQSPGIFALNANTVEKISNPRIDKIIGTYTTQELSETISGRINWLNSFDLTTFALRRDSFLFFEGDWSLLDTVINNVSSPWTAGFIVEFDNRYFSGFEDKFGFFDEVNFDYGDRITRIIETSLSQPNREYMSGSRLELGISQGFNSGEKQSVGLQTTENGVLYGPIIYEDLALIGNYGAKLVWEPPGGLGTYQGFMGIRLITRENVVFNADHLIIKGRT